MNDNSNDNNNSNTNMVQLLLLIIIIILIIMIIIISYGQFSKCHVCFCGLGPGNLKFETVRTHKQHIYF